MPQFSEKNENLSADDITAGTLHADRLPATIPAAKLTGALPAISGAALTGIVAGAHTHAVADITNFTAGLPVATTTVPGVVKIDGTTVTITGGVISAVSNTNTLESFDDTPALTSNNSNYPDYTAWSNNVFVSHPTFGKAFAAFDNDFTTDISAACTNGGLPWSLGMSTQGKRYGGYAITFRLDGSASGQHPSTWTIQGSNSDLSSANNYDNMTWVTLDSRAGQSFALGETKNYTFATLNESNYLHYRIKVTANGGNAYTAIQELQYFEYNATATAVQSVAGIFADLNGNVDIGTYVGDQIAVQKNGPTGDGMTMMGGF